MEQKIQEKKCGTCKKPKPLSEFYGSSYNGKPRSTCKECDSLANKRRYNERKASRNYF